MIETLSESTPIAQKDYICDACRFILDEGSRSFVNDGPLTFAEKRIVAKAKANGWKIKKGQKYLKQANADGGYVYTFRAIPEIHEIMIKYEFYPEV